MYFQTVLFKIQFGDQGVGQEKNAFRGTLDLFGLRIFNVDYEKKIVVKDLKCLSILK